MKQDTDTAARYITPDQSLAALRKAAGACTACELHQKATQTVFGEGPSTARMMLVGEQPGDAEDQDGRPFVGPAGQLLSRALDDTGVDRRSVFVTNVVKHFRWIARGKRRMHQNPKVIHIDACWPWLEAELDRVRPELLLALGATAAKALFGRSFRVTRQRGEAIESELAPHAYATVHPSSIIRMPDGEARKQAYELFVTDLRKAAGSAGLI